MTVFRAVKLVLLAGLISLVIPETTGTTIDSVMISVIPAAEARVGRPLTPVSVAGVARRTTRRCAAGVYNC
jgi:hypothetical protein